MAGRPVVRLGDGHQVRTWLERLGSVLLLRVFLTGFSRGLRRFFLIFVNRWFSEGFPWGLEGSIEMLKGVSKGFRGFYQHSEGV